jgi:basic amino acid/polyamine antiporter, APA family
VAYMRLLPVESIANSSTVAADAMSTIHRSFGNLMAVLIALSTFGSTGIYCMTAPRIYYAMANDGIFFKKLADVHPKYRTPMNAILVQSGWSVLLLLAWGTFEAMVDYVTFIDFAGQVLVATTIFTFRRNRPDAPRSYRTWGYPITPLVFIGICIWFIVFTLWRDSVQAWAGIAVVALGLPMYHFFATPTEAKHRWAFMAIFGTAVLAVAAFFKTGLPLRFLITAPILAGVFSAMLFLWKGRDVSRSSTSDDAK